MSRQGAVVSGVAFAIHRDPRYWDNPNEFIPERWLDSDDKFVTKKGGFLPFGVGELISGVNEKMVAQQV